MSQDPLGSIRRKEPRKRGVFPDDLYRNQVLDPAAAQAWELLGEASVHIYLAHAITLAEQRITDPPMAGRILSALTRDGVNPDTVPHHPLAGFEQRVIKASSADMLQGMAREEVMVAAMRIALRDRLLSFADAVLELRDAIVELAGGNLTTLILATANGQVVQPTSLGHYLAGQLGPLARTSDRIHGAFERLNRSPLGAVSGMSTAMPIRRGRAADLLGFDGVIDSTFDALAGADHLSELSSLVGIAAVEVSRLVADLSYWSRDDVGLLVPGDEFLHHNDAQPQRRDPLVLDYLRSRIAKLTGTPATLTTMLLGRQMLGGEATRLEAFATVHAQLDAASSTLRLLAAVLRSAIVNRALFANRAHRGFATSSELADLLTVDFHIPREQATAIVDRVVIEATEAGGEATTLKPEFIDRIALEEIGQEIGIEPELLAKCLAPKRFIERRDTTGGPAPRAVSASLDRESFAARRERAWIDERRAAIDSAIAALCARRDELITDPNKALERLGAAAATEDTDERGDIL